MTHGAVKLDNYTLDKILVNFPDYNFLLKIDSSHAFGDKIRHFEKLCEVAVGVPTFMIAEVPVHQYGAKENDDVRQRFKLETAELPVFFFLDHRLARGDREALSEVALRYDGPITADDLAAWLRKQGVLIGSPGTIAELDTLVRAFLKEGLSGLRLEEARQLVTEQFGHDKKATTYVKFMEKMKERGADYVAKEQERISKILSGNVKPEKKADFEDKLTLLKHFAGLQQQRDEL